VVGQVAESDVSDFMKEFFYSRHMFTRFACECSENLLLLIDTT
jgi:hypothetical protein